MSISSKTIYCLPPVLLKRVSSLTRQPEKTTTLLSKDPSSSSMMIMTAMEDSASPRVSTTIWSTSVASGNKDWVKIFLRIPTARQPRTTLTLEELSNINQKITLLAMPICNHRFKLWWLFLEANWWSWKSLCSKDLLILCWISVRGLT